MKRDRRVKEATADTATKFWVAVGELETEYKVISQLALTLVTNSSQQCHRRKDLLGDQS